MNHARKFIVVSLLTLLLLSTSIPFAAQKRTGVLTPTVVPTPVWDRQGTVISAGFSFDYGNVQEATGLEDIVCFLVPSPCLRFVHTSGYDVVTSSYAEAPIDPVTREAGVIVRYSLPILPDDHHSQPFLFKWHDRYRILAMGGTAALDLFDSADGLHGWVLLKSRALPQGPGGQWDSSLVANSFVWPGAGDTLNILYEAVGGAGTSWAVGNATSSDGGLNWGGRSSQPVLTGANGMVGGPMLLFDGNMVYLICHSQSSNPSGTDIYGYHTTISVPGELPTNWIADGLLLHREGADEGNSDGGQLADPWVRVRPAFTDTANVFHSAALDMYMTATMHASQASGAFHVKMATFHGTLAQLFGGVAPSPTPTPTPTPSPSPSPSPSPTPLPCVITAQAVIPGGGVELTVRCQP